MYQEENYDVAVIGGGPAGVAAAIAAGRSGAKTCLIERYDVLGGMGTAGLVNNFCNAHFDGERYIIGGIFADIRGRLIDSGSLFVTEGMEPFNHQAYGELLAAACQEAGVAIMLNTEILSSDFSERQTRFRCARGRAISARTVVDATGDATILHSAGVRCSMGRPKDGAVMPLTFCYVIGPVDIAELEAGLPDAFQMDLKSGLPYIYLGGQPQLIEWIRQARQAGELTIPRDRIAVAYAIPGAREYIAVNFGRVMVEDPTDSQQLAEADKIGRAQADEGEAFFRKYVPGFKSARITEYARQIGVRESRQIEGRYCMTGEDVLQCRQFDDVIAQGRYSIDIHEPNSESTTLITLPFGKHYDIPLRSLIPTSGPANLIAAGRCISATHEAMSSFRVSPSVMAIGEAAGVIASLAALRDTDVADVPYDEVREVLLTHNGILH